MPTRVISVPSRRPAQDWQFVVAIGFLALIGFGAVIDRRGAVLDKTLVASQSVDRAAVPPTSAELVRDMLSHD